MRAMLFAGSLNSSYCHIIAMSQQSKPVWQYGPPVSVLLGCTGVVGNAEELLESHKVATQSSLGTRSSTKKLVFTKKTDLQKEFAISVSQEVKKYTQQSQLILYMYIINFVFLQTKQGIKQWKDVQLSSTSHHSQLQQFVSLIASLVSTITNSIGGNQVSPSYKEPQR